MKTTTLGPPEVTNRTRRRNQQKHLWWPCPFQICIYWKKSNPKLSPIGWLPLILSSIPAYYCSDILLENLMLLRQKCLEKATLKKIQWNPASGKIDPSKKNPKAGQSNMCTIKQSMGLIFNKKKLRAKWEKIQPKIFFLVSKMRPDMKMVWPVKHVHIKIIHWSHF